MVKIENAKQLQEIIKEINGISIDIDCLSRIIPKGNTVLYCVEPVKSDYFKILKEESGNVFFEGDFSSLVEHAVWCVESYVKSAVKRFKNNDNISDDFIKHLQEIMLVEDELKHLRKRISKETISTAKELEEVLVDLEEVAKERKALEWLLMQIKDKVYLLV